MAKTSHSNGFQGLVLSTARITGLYGWDESVAEEYCRPILAKLSPTDAVTAFRAIYDREQRMPAQAEILEAKQSNQIDRFCAYCRETEGWIPKHDAKGVIRYGKCRHERPERTYTLEELTSRAI